MICASCLGWMNRPVRWRMPNGKVVELCLLCDVVAIQIRDDVGDEDILRLE